MIPYEELDRALGRWKARGPGGAEAGHTTSAPPAGRDDMATVEKDTDGYGGVPRPMGDAREIPRGTDTGELDLEEAVLETYDDGDER